MRTAGDIKTKALNETEGGRPSAAFLLYNFVISSRLGLTTEHKLLILFYYVFSAIYILHLLKTIVLFTIVFLFRSHFFY